MRNVLTLVDTRQDVAILRRGPDGGMGYGHASNCGAAMQRIPLGILRSRPVRKQNAVQADKPRLLFGIHEAKRPLEDCSNRTNATAEEPPFLPDCCHPGELAFDYRVGETKRFNPNPLLSRDGTTEAIESKASELTVDPPSYR